MFVSLIICYVIRGKKRRIFNYFHSHSFIKSIFFFYVHSILTRHYHYYDKKIFFFFLHKNLLLTPKPQLFFFLFCIYTYFFLIIISDIIQVHTFLWNGVLLINGSSFVVSVWSRYRVSTRNGNVTWLSWSSVTAS